MALDSPTVAADEQVVDDLGFDPAALREKYLAERNKRLRADANEQYVEIKDRYAHYLDDPYVAPGFTRAALTDKVDVVVIGGGFGGMLAAARLREAGVDDIAIIEKGGDFGGTWYGTAIRAQPATSSPTSICRCWKRSATSRSRSIPAPPRSSPTAAR
jgi:heterodisulfide reductase subunit A-like polyferredoxin